MGTTLPPPKGFMLIFVFIFSVLYLCVFYMCFSSISLAVWPLVAYFGRPFVKRFALCYRSVVCPVCPVLSVLSCLSVTFVHCGQTVGRIKTKLGMQVDLGRGHIVLDGDPAPPHPKGHSPRNFRPYLLRPNGCMDQDVTWYGAKPRPRRPCVRWGPRSPSPKGGGASPPNFRPMFIAAKRLDG